MRKNTTKCAELSPNELIEQENARLSAIFKNIQPAKAATCRNLIQNAAFMAVQLKKLQSEIDRDGWVSTYDNGGGQGGTRQSPAGTSYLKMVGTYNQIIANLVKLLPDEDKDQARAQSDPMADYLLSR